MIHWDFIAACEGGMRLAAYVPPDAAEASGATVAGGVDLGRIGVGELAALPAALAARLKPYCGLRGADARRAVLAHPLVLTAAEAAALMAVKSAGFLSVLRRRFDGKSAISFDRLADGPATVLMSLAWQYGNPWTDKRCGAVWSLACAGDWLALAAYLRSGFPDPRFGARRQREADFLLAHLSVSQRAAAA